MGKYDHIRDVRDDVAKQQIKEDYVQILIAEGNSPLASIGKLSPEAWSTLPGDSLDELAIAFDHTPPSTERDQALDDFYSKVEFALKNNPQTFQKIINGKGEAAVDRILAQYATTHPGVPATLKGLMAVAKTPQAPLPPARQVPGAVLARDAAGNWTATAATSPEQQRLFQASDADIMNTAAAANGWDDYATNRPEDVMFIYHNRGDLPAIKAAAEGALKRTGHLPP